MSATQSREKTMKPLKDKISTNIRRLFGGDTEAAGHPLDRLRFGPEKDLLDQLFERFDLEQVISHLVESDEAVPYYQFVLAQQLRLTPLLAPRVFKLFEEVREELGFDEPVGLFVCPNPMINAFALQRLKKDDCHVISLTSETVKSMTDDELRFVLGHEIGHLHFRHYRVMLVYQMLEPRPGENGSGSEQARQQIPPLLQRRLDSWCRLSELTADRFGFLATGEALPVAVSSFFKNSQRSGAGASQLRSCRVPLSTRTDPKS
jgi:hypothetical protein